MRENLSYVRMRISGCTQFLMGTSSQSVPIQSFSFLFLIPEILFSPHSVNSLAHNIVRWASSSLFEGSVPCDMELFVNFPSVYSGADPPWFCFRCWLVLSMKYGLTKKKKEKKKKKGISLPSYSEARYLYNATKATPKKAAYNDAE